MICKIRKTEEDGENPGYQSTYVSLEDKIRQQFQFKVNEKNERIRRLNKVLNV